MMLTHVGSKSRRWIHKSSYFPGSTSPTKRSVHLTIIVTIVILGVAHSIFYLKYLITYANIASIVLPYHNQLPGWYPHIVH